MTQRIPFSDSSVNQTINHEQLNQIIEAILAGKYSWACFLLLRCIGHDPLHYLPYRTYNRLVKENCQTSKLQKLEVKELNASNRYSEFNSEGVAVRPQVSKITDLDYLEVANKHNKCLKGRAAKQEELKLHGLSSAIQKVRCILSYK